MVNLAGRLQRLNRAVELPGQARDDWEILRDLTQAITGKSHNFQQIEDVFQAITTTTPAFQDLTLAKIPNQGIPITDTGYQIPLLERENR